MWLYKISACCCLNGAHFSVKPHKQLLTMAIQVGYGKNYAKMEEMGSGDRINNIVLGPLANQIC